MSGTFPCDWEALHRTLAPLKKQGLATGSSFASSSPGLVRNLLTKPLSRLEMAGVGEALTIVEFLGHSDTKVNREVTHGRESCELGSDGEHNAGLPTCDKPSKAFRLKTEDTLHKVLPSISEDYNSGEV